MARGLVLWMATFLALNYGGPARETFATETAVSAKKPWKAGPRAMTLEAFIHRALADGSPGIVPGPFAELIGVPKDIPTYNVKLSRDQTNDNMNHLFKGRGNETAESNDIHVFLSSRFKNFCARSHNSKINHRVVIAS